MHEDHWWLKKMTTKPKGKKIPSYPTTQTILIFFEVFDAILVISFPSFQPTKDVRIHNNLNF
jgi:hypothetical protein